MKAILLKFSMLIVLSLFNYNSYCQEILNLQYFKHVKRQGGNASNTFLTPSALINENGWMFLRNSIVDSFELEDASFGLNTNKPIVFAFDENGNKRWQLFYDTSYSESGGMQIFGSSDDNSLIVRLGAQSYINFPGHEKITFSGFKPVLCKIDSNGIVTKFRVFENLELPVGFGSYNYGNYIVSQNLLDKTISLIDEDLNVVYHKELPISSSQQSAIIDDAGNTYFLISFHPGASRTIGDSLYVNDTTLRNFMLFKFDNANNKVWEKTFYTNTPQFINDNKMLRLDKNNELFVALTYRNDLEVDGETIPFMDNSETHAQQTKSVVLRLNSSDGKLISAHYDKNIEQNNQTIEQTIWLETDFNGQIYAYLFSESRLDSFDQVHFGTTHFDAHRILWWNPTIGAFDRSFTQRLGRLEMSLQPTRFAFWSTNTFTNHILTGGIEVIKKWDADYIIAVFDTAQSPENLSIENEKITSTNVSLYPNPNKGEIFIKNNESVEVVVTIYDIQMRLIKEVRLLPNETKNIEYSKVAGTYIFHSKTESGKFNVHKVISH